MEISSLMEKSKIIYPSDFKHGSFYEDLSGNVFCFSETEEGRFLEYTNKGPSMKSRKFRIDAVPELSQGVLEVDIRGYSEGLKEEIRQIKSLEQLASETKLTRPK